MFVNAVNATKKLSTFSNNLLTHTGFAWPGWASILIWKIGFLILVGLTVNEFYPLLYEYQHNNVATQIKVVSHNMTLRPPSIALAMPRVDAQLQKLIVHLQKRTSNQTSTCLECETLVNNSWDVWRDIDFRNETTLHDYRFLISAAFMTKLLEQEDNFKVLRSNNSDWNQPIAEAVWNFLACLNRLDQRLGFFDNRKNHYWCLEEKSSETLLSNRTKIDQLYERLNYILMGRVFFGNLVGERSIFNRVWNENLFQEIRSILFNDAFCFEIPISENGSGVVVDSLNMRNTWPSLNESKGAFYLFSDHSPITWPLTPFRSSSALFQSEAPNEDIHITYSITLSVTESREGVHCYQGTSIECKGNCMIDKVIESCRCVPFTFRNHVPNSKLLPYCTAKLYNWCPINKAKEVENCARSCSNLCKYDSYQWQLSRVGTAYDRKRLYVAVKPMVRPFVEFTVTYKNTQEQFLSQIGAVFSFYLGFSGLSVVAVVVYCINWGKRWYHRKQLNNRVSQRQQQQQQICEHCSMQMQDALAPPPVVTEGSLVSNAEMATKRDMERLEAKLKEAMEKIRADMYLKVLVDQIEVKTIARSEN